MFWGMAEQDEKSNVLKWAKGILAPGSLTQCFLTK